MFGRSVLSKISSVAQVLLESNQQDDSRDEKAGGPVVSKEKFDDLTRRYWEQFHVIEKVLAERDQWKDLYKKHVLEHLAAQSMVARSLVTTRTQLGKLLVITNKLLEEKGIQPIKTPEGVDPADSHPVEIVERFAERMIAARKLISSDLDAVAERDRIAKDLPRP